MDLHIFSYLIVGAAMLGVVVIPHLLSRGPLAFPVLYVIFGAAAFGLAPGVPPLVPSADYVQAKGLEYAAEIAVLLSLIGVGMRLDSRPGERSWRVVWLLLGLTMPLTIAAMAGLGYALLGLPLATAVLLGAVLSPTDPVLAGAVQVGGPGEGEEDEVRFSLTCEAGLNDGLAFPFTYLALTLAAGMSTPEDLATWVALDILYRVIMGLAVGAIVARALAWYMFRQADTSWMAKVPGLFFMTLVALAYGLSELVNGYGFLAVFAAGLAARGVEPDSPYHKAAFRFYEQVEHAISAISLIVLGGLLVGERELLSWQVVAMAAALLILVRPLSGWLALLPFAHLMPGERRATAFFGIRGVGSLYYLAFAQTRASFEGLEQVWGVVLAAIALSSILHGSTAGAVMEWLDGKRSDA